MIEQPDPLPLLRLSRAALYGLVVSGIGAVANYPALLNGFRFWTAERFVEYLVGLLLPGPVLFVTIAAAINFFRRRRRK